VAIAFSSDSSLCSGIAWLATLNQWAQNETDINTCKLGVFLMRRHEKRPNILNRGCFEKLSTSEIGVLSESPTKPLKSKTMPSNHDGSCRLPRSILRLMRPLNKRFVFHLATLFSCHLVQRQIAV
jgi:hypothetical protein